ncbi:Pentatricopeptide repeat-containing protein [Camellia lanceoleosa]|uniref:Pentatricopeptide repeat-containing protein n=1 Tax=Camellia lanceoleosa TaxID=1840588 RepID=A0ACC0HHG3_9ERIC|nr:Pentatricopeptide repeat-containing protein [Camellia lanceoleosa]
MCTIVYYSSSMYIWRMKPTPPFILQYWTSSCSFFTCTLLRLRPYSATATATATATADFSPSPSLLIDEFTRFCYQRDLPRAMKAMESMQKHQLWADSITYSELIKCCLAHHAIHHGRLIHKHLFSHVHRPATFLINILLNMYVKFNLLDDAQALFDQMPHRNVVSWTTLISAYANANAMLHHNKALQFLILILRDGVRPNMFTYSSVLRASHGLPNLQQLHSSIIKTGLDSDVFVRSALIDIYSKWGELHNSLRIFDEMVTADLVVWNSIIGGFAQNTDGDEALNLFKRIKRAGFWADQGTLTSVLRACTGLALLELGRQIHVHVLKFNQDLILDNALLDMYCKCGSLEDANSVFSPMVETDVVSWSTMIMGLAQNGFSRKALQLFESMKASGTKPNYITILGVLFACSHAGLVEDGQYYFQSMNKCFGIDPGREHYGCMVDLLGRAGKLDEAVKLIHEMECEPDTVTWRALLGACRVHRNTDLAIYAAKKILNLKPNDAGTYILLSNIYANSQKWEDVAEVRRAMRGQGVGKEPGEQKEDSLSYHSEKLAIVFDFHSGLGSKSLGVSKEKLRTNLKTNEIPTEVLIPGLSNSLGNNGVRVNEANVMVTPGNSGTLYSYHLSLLSQFFKIKTFMAELYRRDKVKSIPSSGSGHSFLSNNSNVNSGRPCASSRHSWSGLEPVAEENSWQQPDLNFKLARPSENGLTPENSN